MPLQTASRNHCPRAFELVSGTLLLLLGLFWMYGCAESTPPQTATELEMLHASITKVDLAPGERIRAIGQAVERCRDPEELVTLLMSALDSEHEDIREAASAALAGFGGWAIPSLLDGLEANDRAYPESVVTSLARAKRGRETVRVELARRAASSPAVVAMRALDGLRILLEGHEATGETLQGALEHAEAVVRAEAVRILGDAEELTSRLETAVIDLAEDPSWAVRAEVALALGRGVGMDSRGDDVLERLRQDSAQRVRAASGRAQIWRLSIDNAPGDQRVARFR